MDKLEELIASKKNSKSRKDLIAEFEKLKKNKSKKSGLSPKNIKIALLLLDGLEEFSIKGQSNYRGTIEIGTKRFEELTKISKPAKFWSGEQSQLLDYLFGKELAKLAKKAWDIIPSLMYQSGYYRRSFRASNLESIYFKNQLNFIINLIYEASYDFTVEEYACYSNKIYAPCFSYIFAAAIQLKDKNLTQLFLDAVYGRHKIAMPSREIIKGMLISENEECLIAVEKLLLSAQRQEGLRQTILESLDETSLMAMKHFIKVIIDNKLSRFSSVVRAVDTWAGLGWEAEKEKTVKRFLELADLFLSDPSKIKKAVSSKDNAEVYMALWAQGVVDVVECKPLLDIVLKGSNEKISLALYFISQINISSFSIDYGMKFLSNDHPIIICQAASLINDSNFTRIIKGRPKKKNELYTQLESRLDCLPTKMVKSKPTVFSWMIFSYGKEVLFDLMINLLDYNKESEFDKILPYFKELPVSCREQVSRSIFPEFSSYNYNEKDKRPILTKKKRALAFLLLKDRSEWIKTTAIRALNSASLNDSEIQVFEGLLTRKSGDFRKSTIQLIIKKGEKQIKESAARLTLAKNVDQRLAGLDLLLWLKENSNKHKKWAIQTAEAYNSRKKKNSKEEVILSGLLEADNPVNQFNAENGFGLYDPSKLLKNVKLESKTTEEFSKVNKKNFGLSTTPKKVNAALEKLGKLVHENKEYEYTCEYWNGQVNTVLLGNTFNRIKYSKEKRTAEETFCNYPLPEVWRKWFKDSGLTSRDLFLINLNRKNKSGKNITKNKLSNFKKKILSEIYIAEIPKFGTYEWQNPINDILTILENRYPYKNEIDYLSGLIHKIFNSLDDKLLKLEIESENQYSDEKITWYDINAISTSWSALGARKRKMNKQQFEQFWKFSEWRYSIRPDKSKVESNFLPSLYDYARAYTQKLTDINSVYLRALLPDAIADLTKIHNEKSYDVRKEFPFLNEISDKCRDRILEIEMVRGDSSTAVSILAQSIQKLFGIENFAKVLKALGKDNLYRGYIYSWSNQARNKKEILSTLLKRCYPSKDCSQKDFDQLISESKISEKRLCDAATYAPQWLPLVAKNLDWKEMESGVWWLHAHTNSRHDAQTETEIGKHSSVEIPAFRDGAVDIDWFKEIYKALGSKKWSMLYDAAKYVSDGAGHKRGLLYVDVILGKVKITAIKAKIKATRNQNYLRVFGVVPLSKTKPEEDVLKRYQYLQKFKKESKQFGSQRQASESIAVKIAMENLARTAGYPDPIRLQWAMETKEAQEIIKKAGSLELGDTTVKLEINEQGLASVMAYKAGKVLKSIPAKHRKNKAVLELKAFNKTLREQYRRTRKSLENAMVNGDEFSKQEIETLAEHPVVAPILKKLVLLSDKNQGFYDGKKLLDSKGKSFKLGDKIRIAHCVDLFKMKKWAAFQKYCFEKELAQPFKQIFRELYIPSKDELKSKTVSRRYAGHQVQTRKTVALLKGLKWTVDYDDGLQKVNHKQNIITRMYAMADWFSPADVESPTLETIEFHDRKTGKKLAFDKIDGRIFSESMRDIDLVVSVAHVGGVDPEASQSSIELRAVIVEETCRLFKLKNVKISKNHAKINGELGNYSVHLGSGVCHKLAGSALYIIPVHSQHRGRMFLPFIDDDPKTAEIVSKVLLLAKDKEIKDPTILGQI